MPILQMRTLRFRLFLSSALGLQSRAFFSLRYFSGASKIQVYVSKKKKRKKGRKETPCPLSFLTLPPKVSHVSKLMLHCNDTCRFSKKVEKGVFFVFLLKKREWGEVLPYTFLRNLLVTRHRHPASGKKVTHLM